MTVIDAYTHLLSTEILSEFAKNTTGEMAQYVEMQRARSLAFPHAGNVQKRLAIMDKFKIDYQVVMPVPAVDPSMLISRSGGKQVLKFAALIIDRMAELPRKSHGRMFPVGVAPLLGDEGAGEAIDEMDRSVKDLGIKGFMVPTNVDTVAVDTFGYLWDEATKLDVPIFIHPANTKKSEDRPYEREYGLMHAFGWPYQTTLVLSRLVFSGTLDRNPNLKVVAHHLGGMIPFYAGRIVESYRRDPKMPSMKELVAVHQSVSYKDVNLRKSDDLFGYFKMLYYDTAVGGSQSALMCGYEVFGADHLVFATDFPYGPEEGTKRLATYPAQVRELGLRREEEEKLLYGNIKKILRLE